MKKIISIGVLFLALILAVNSVSVVAGPAKAVKEVMDVYDKMELNNLIADEAFVIADLQTAVERSEHKLNGADIGGRKMPVNKVAGGPDTAVEEIELAIERIERRMLIERNMLAADGTHSVEKLEMAVEKIERA